MFVVMNCILDIIVAEIILIVFYRILSVGV